MLKLLQNQKIIAILISFIGVLFAFPIYFESGIWSLSDYSQNWFSLDPSWNYTISHSFINNKKWGEDFVLTYGPLGFLSTRMLLGINKYGLFSYDVFVAINVFLFLYYSQIKSFSQKLVLPLILLSVLSIPVFIGAGSSILLLIIQTFWMRELLNKQSIINFVMPLLISLLLIFMKFNTGFISIILLMCVWCYLLIIKRDKWKWIILSILTYSVVFIIISRWLNVSILPYIKNGFLMVSGYSEIMHLNQEKYDELFMGITVLILSVLILMYSLKKSGLTLHYLFIITLLFSVPAYILYKQGFTRADDSHIREFYCYFPLLLLAFSDFRNNNNSHTVKAMPIAIAFICLFFSKRTEQNILDNTLGRLNKAEYIKSYINYSSTSGIHLDSSLNQLPAHIKTKIANSSIDAYPWNIIELVENHFNINTRPVIQSYTAYTKGLEKLNFEYYNSNKCPDYVLYEYGSIDNRYPLTDEPLLNLTYFNNYSVADTVYSYGRVKLLLKKNEVKKQIHLKETKTYELTMNDKIFPKKNTYYEVYVKTNMKGKIRSLLYNPPQIVLQIVNGDKQLYEYHTSTSLLESGFFSDRFYASTDDVLKMYNNTNHTLHDSVLFYGIRPLNTDCFENKITVKEYQLLFN